MANFEVTVNMGNGKRETFNTSARNSEEARDNVVEHLDECELEYVCVVSVLRARYNPDD